MNRMDYSQFIHYYTSVVSNNNMIAYHSRFDATVAEDASSPFDRKWRPYQLTNHSAGIGLHWAEWEFAKLCNIYGSVQAYFRLSTILTVRVSTSKIKRCTRSSRVNARRRTQ